MDRIIHWPTARKLARHKRDRTKPRLAYLWMLWLLLRITGFFILSKPAPQAPELSANLRRFLDHTWYRVLRVVQRYPLASLQLIVLCVSHSWSAGCLLVIAGIVDLALSRLAIDTLAVGNLNHAKEYAQRLPNSRFYEVPSRDIVNKEFASRVLSIALPQYSRTNKPGVPVRAFLVSAPPKAPLPLEPYTVHYRAKWVTFLPCGTLQDGAWQRFTVHHAISHAAFRTADQLEVGSSNLQALSIVVWTGLFLPWTQASVAIWLVTVVGLFAANNQWNIVTGAAMSRFIGVWLKADELAYGELSIAELGRIAEIFKRISMKRPGLDDEDNEYLSSYRSAQLTRIIKAGVMEVQDFVPPGTRKKSAVYLVAILGLGCMVQHISAGRLWIAGGASLVALIVAALVWSLSNACEFDLFREANDRPAAPPNPPSAAMVRSADEGDCQPVS